MEALAICDEDSRSVKELLAEMSGEELYSAQYETSTLYNAIIVTRAIEIVRKATRLSSNQMMTKLSISRNTYYNWVNGRVVINNKRFETYMERLALIRETAA